MSWPRLAYSGGIGLLSPLIWRRVGSSQLVLEAEAMERVIEILQSSGLTMAYVARTGDRV